MLANAFLAFINEHRLFTPAQSILVAVSGGLDSVVLLHLLRQHGFSVGVAHVNFGLRGADSDADAAFVENMAVNHGVPFHSVQFDTAAEARLRGESIQVTARQLRYTWFAEIQTTHRYVAVATAHHLNDVLETMLLNLTRGTGLAGLRGMPRQAHHPDTGLRLVRPLWFATRAAIETYAAQQGLVWREDVSNATDAYSRNLLRHRVVPVLEQINPGLLTALPRSVEVLRAADALVQAELATSFNHCVHEFAGGLVISVARLGTLPEPLFRLGEWLRPYGFTPDVLVQCWKAVTTRGGNGQVFNAPAHRLLHDRGNLWLLPPATVPPALTVTTWPAAALPLGADGYLTARLLNRADWDEQWPQSPALVYLDADTLPLPWELRRWQPGDRFAPLGLSGTQLVSDFLGNQKVPLPQRERTWVLVCGEKIGWIVGLRATALAQIMPKTKRIAVLEWQPAGSFAMPETWSSGA